MFLLPSTSAPLPVINVTVVALTLPVSAMPAVRPLARTSRLLPTEKLPNWSMMLLVLVTVMAAVVAADRVLMSISSKLQFGTYWYNAPLTASSVAKPADTVLAVALLAVMLVMVLKTPVVVTVPTLAPAMFSTRGLPAASVPVTVKPTVLSLPALVKVTVWAVRKRRFADTSCTAPAPLNVCAKPMAPVPATSPTCQVPVCASSERRLTALPPPPAWVISTAGVFRVSALVVSKRPYSCTALPPPSTRILPLPALRTLSVSDCVTPTPVNVIRPPLLVMSVVAPKVSAPAPAFSKISPPAVVRFASE